MVEVFLLFLAFILVAAVALGAAAGTHDGGRSRRIVPDWRPDDPPTPADWNPSRPADPLDDGFRSAGHDDMWPTPNGYTSGPQGYGYYSGGIRIDND